MLPLFPRSYFIFFIFQSKKCYEKVGEATETALIVLVEKMNVTGIDLTSKTKAEKAHTCNDALRSLYKKVFFSFFFSFIYFITFITYSQSVLEHITP